MTCTCTTRMRGCLYQYRIHSHQHANTTYSLRVLNRRVGYTTGHHLSCAVRIVAWQCSKVCREKKLFHWCLSANWDLCMYMCMHEIYVCVCLHGVILTVWNILSQSLASTTVTTKLLWNLLLSHKLYFSYVCHAPCTFSLQFTHHTEQRKCLLMVALI